MANEITQKELPLENGWTVWQVTGRIDTKTADEAYAMGEEIVKRGVKTALDMSGMDYLSSAGLRVLLRLHKLAKKSGGEFTVAGPVGMVKTVLEDSGMDVLLKARESVNDLE